MNSRIARALQLAVTAACLLAHNGVAQTRTVGPTAVGTWRGTSTCTGRPSACKDEVVVFRITRAKVSDSLLLDGRKVVNGQEEEMGVLGCRITAVDKLSCTIPSGVWRFTVRADSLVGDLRRSDSTKLRDVRTTRSR